jgi:hypothetical protein
VKEAQSSRKDENWGKGNEADLDGGKLGLATVAP